MRRTVYLLLCLFILPVNFLFLSAQTSQDRKMNVADHQKRKMEYITKQAGLTQAEVKEFFPLHNELTQKKFALHKNHRDKVQRIKENSNITEEEYKKMLGDDVDVKIKEAALDKEYSAKFEKILSPEKLFKVQQAEREFIQREVSNFRKDEKNSRKR